MARTPRCYLCSAQRGSTVRYRTFPGWGVPARIHYEMWPGEYGDPVVVTLHRGEGHLICARCKQHLKDEAEEHAGKEN